MIEAMVYGGGGEVPIHVEYVTFSTSGSTPVTLNNLSGKTRAFFFKNNTTASTLVEWNETDGNPGYWNDEYGYVNVSAVTDTSITFSLSGTSASNTWAGWIVY